jgi:hypothetical protein
MYVVVQTADDGGYGSIRPQSKGYGLNKRGLALCDKRTAALAGSIVSALALMALVFTSHTDSPVSEESISSGSITKVNPQTGQVETQKADPGIFMQVWWNTSADFDKLKFWANSGVFDPAKVTSDKLRKRIGDPQISTFTPVINFPTASTIQATVGPSLPDQGSGVFGTIICMWKGRLEVKNAGEYNLTLSSSANGAIFTMGSGINMIVNDLDGFLGEELFVQRTDNFEAGISLLNMIMEIIYSFISTNCQTTCR